MGRLAPAQGGVLTSNVLGIDVSQGLQADHAGNTDATSAISRFPAKYIFQYGRVHSVH